VGAWPRTPLPSTDQLIDQIVYDLSGLTDEEIEIVEDAVGEITTNSAVPDS
jgi:hypothetical protein